MIQKHKVPIKHICSFGNQGHIDTLYIAESIEDLKEWFEPSVAKSDLCISMHGNLYTIGSYCLAWGCEADD